MLYLNSRVYLLVAIKALMPDPRRTIHKPKNQLTNNQSPPKRKAPEQPQHVPSNPPQMDLRLQCHLNPPLRLVLSWG